MSGMVGERAGKEDAPGLSSAVPVACSARTVVPRAMRACMRDMLVGESLSVSVSRILTV